MNAKGFGSAFKELTKMQERAKKAPQNVAMKLAGLIEVDARNNAPVDLGNLRNAIGKEALENGAVVFVSEVNSVPYGAFQEFGTGFYVSVPAELADEAQKFKGFKTGNAEDFVEAIRQWCVRKGIEERAAYPIAMSILRKGLHPQPFFYPAIEKNREKLASLIQEELDRI